MTFIAGLVLGLALGLFLALRWGNLFMVEVRGQMIT
jgi:hypothetical protein